MEKKIQKAVDKIIKDLCGRSGGDHWFEQCDEEIQEEIRHTWVDIILKEIKKK